MVHPQGGEIRLDFSEVQPAGPIAGWLGDFVSAAMGLTDKSQSVIRVCAAVVKDNAILMVFHRDTERAYWTLPGGKVEAGETPEQAVVRELEEETGLSGYAPRFLFDEGFGSGLCRCFWVNTDPAKVAVLGFDPEEAHLNASARLLQGVGWHTRESMQNDNQVARVFSSLAEVMF